MGGIVSQWVEVGCWSQVAVDMGVVIAALVPWVPVYAGTTGGRVWMWDVRFRSLGYARNDITGRTR